MSNIIAISRFPLDHVFHSNCFSLRHLRRLDYSGSDHFPIYIELQFEPEVAPEQPELPKEPDDEEQAQEIINREEQEEQKPVQSVKSHEEGDPAT